MEIWFIIILAIIAIVAIALLLFLELMGDDAVNMLKLKHKRGKYINDQTAVIFQTIRDMSDPAKSYSVFIEYIFTNHKQFLNYTKETLKLLGKAYFSKDVEALTKYHDDIKEMKIELKDQKTSQDECMTSIDKTYFIESAAWIHLANNCRFAINEGLKRLDEVCIEYVQNFTEPFPERYAEQLDFLTSDICNICTTAHELIGSGDIENMRELRKRMSIILSESYANTQRLYEHLHDGRSSIDREKRISMQYALNAFQECHNMIYTLRRFVLANICLTLSLQH